MNNKKTKLKNSVSCGDWHLGWGFGGNDKLGKLSIDRTNNQFIWNGYSQGRHGQKWNAGAELIFTIEKGEINVISQKGSVPSYSELLKIANELINQ